MAFKIVQKIKPLQVQDKSLDLTFMAKYLKGIQKTLLTKTSPETPTDYFFCNNYSGKDDLLVFGTQAPAYRKIFKETAKGKHGFEKEKISIGKCFVINENNKNILCIQHNKALSKGKKAIIMRSFRKILRSSLKQIKDVRWIEGMLQDLGGGENMSQNTTDKEGVGSNIGDDIATPLVSAKEIEDRGKQLEKGIKKLKNDVLTRYKKRITNPKDAAFIQALRKAANIWLFKLSQTDEKTADKLDKQRADLEKMLPQWKELEEKILKAKSREEIKEELKGSIQKLNQKRTRIKELLKKVNLKAALS